MTLKEVKHEANQEKHLARNKEGTDNRGLPKKGGAGKGNWGDEAEVDYEEHQAHTSTHVKTVDKEQFEKMKGSE